MAASKKKKATTKKSPARKKAPASKKKTVRAVKAKPAPKKKAKPAAKKPAKAKPATTSKRSSQRATVRIKRQPADPDKTPVKTPIPGAGAQDPPTATHATSTSARVEKEKTGADRREHLRVPYGAWVTVMRGGRQTFCLARDISSGGMFLKAEDPPHLGDEVKLLLVIENDRTPLELQGLVVRRSPGEHGFGVRFMGVDSAAAGRIRGLVGDASAGLWKPPHDPSSPPVPRDDS